MNLYIFSNKLRLRPFSMGIFLHFLDTREVPIKMHYKLKTLYDSALQYEGEKHEKSITTLFECSRIQLRVEPSVSNDSMQYSALKHEL